MRNKLSKRIKKLSFIYKIFIIILVFLFSFIAVIGDALVSIDPPSQTVSTSQSFSINIYCDPGQPIKSYEFKISFNPYFLKANSVTEGNIFNGYNTFFNSGDINNVAGTIINIYGFILGKGNVTKPGILVTISFTAKTSVGTSLLHIYELGLTNETNYIPITNDDGNVTINSSDNSGSDDNSTGGGGTNIPLDNETNNPPNQPVKPSGSTSIEKGVTYEYSSYTYDIDQDKVKIMFDWGDGFYSNWSEFVTSNTTISMSHSWNALTNYTIKVIAQDEKGINSSWSDPLLVNVSEFIDDPPYMEINTTITNETVFFDASGCYDPDGTIVSYQWDFGDGVSIISTNKTITHIYNDPGDYIVTLLVTDNKGDTYNTSIKINASEINLQKEEAEPFAFFNIINIFIFIIIISILIVFRDAITIFLLDTRIYLLKHKTYDVKNKLYKPNWRTNKINYYSTVTTPPFSVKKSDHSKYTPKILYDYRLKKEKQLYNLREFYEEEKRLNGYYNFNIGDKIDKLIKTNIKHDKYNVDHILEDIRREIDTFNYVDEPVNYLDVEKQVDELILSKLMDKINGI